MFRRILLCEIAMAAARDGRCPAGSATGPSSKTASATGSSSAPRAGIHHPSRSSRCGTARAGRSACWRRPTSGVRTAGVPAPPPPASPIATGCCPPPATRSSGPHGPAGAAGRSGPRKRSSARGAGSVSGEPFRCPGPRPPSPRRIGRRAPEAPMAQSNPFGAKTAFEVGGKTYTGYRLSALEEAGVGPISRLPYSHPGPARGRAAEPRRLRVHRAPTSSPSRTTTRRTSASKRSRSLPGRVVLQDFTGVPAVVDLAAMRAAMERIGGDPQKINPLVPVRSGDRPLGAGRRVRHGRRAAASTSRSSSSATASATSS